MPPERQVWDRLCRHDGEGHAPILRIDPHRTDGGIGGGAPSQKHDIRLGDVVVECPLGRTRGVLSYKYGKEVQGKEFEITGSLNSPPTLLLTTLNQLDAIHERKGHHIAEIIRTMVTKNPRVREKHRYPSAEKDR